jgi:hypothetical protein
MTLSRHSLIGPAVLPYLKVARRLRRYGYDRWVIRQRLAAYRERKIAERQKDTLVVIGLTIYIAVGLAPAIIMVLR